MQGGHLTSPAKSDWISIIWTGLSLLQEQGGYYSLAGRINRTIASIGVMDLVRSRVTVTTSNSPLARGELLRLAGVAPSDKKAAEAWLAIELAQSMSSRQTTTTPRRSQRPTC